MRPSSQAQLAFPLRTIVRQAVHAENLLRLIAVYSLVGLNAGQLQRAMDQQRGPAVRSSFLHEELLRLRKDSGLT